VAFYAVGAYLWAFFGSQQIFRCTLSRHCSGEHAFPAAANMFYLFIPLGMIAAALVGILLGLPVLRVRGDYLAIVTLVSAK